MQIVSVEPCYDAYFKWHMPICVERCHAEPIYVIFGTVTERAFRKKIPSRGTYTNDATLRSGFFFRETRSMTVPRLGFFQDSQIRVNMTLSYCYA